MYLRSSLIALAALALPVCTAQAAESYDNCTGFIDSLPATITQQGTWCLRKHLATAVTTGKAIQVATNNVTLHCNDFRVSNSAGMATEAVGIYASQRRNIVVRNCDVRGFMYPIQLSGGGGHEVVDNRVTGGTHMGVLVSGAGSVVRGNFVRNTGGSTSTLTTDEPTGILASGSVDVLDNTIEGVTGMAWARGIAVSANEGGSIVGNRIRGVSSANWQSVGIVSNGSAHMDIRENHIAASAAGTQGLWCTDAKSRASDNAINGFATALVGCGDAGGNDSSP